MTVPAESHDLCLWDVVEEHRDEAEFLLELRGNALRSPLYTLDELEATIEPRLLAHLDGLVVGGAAVAERVLLPCIQEAEASSGLATVAALALLSGARPGASLQLVLDSLSDDADEPRRAGLCEALRLSQQPALPGLLAAALRAAKTEPARAALLQALAAQPIDPGPPLDDALQSSDPHVLCAALAAAAASARSDALGAVHAQLASANTAVRDAAIEAGLVLGSSYAWEACTGFGAKPGPDDSRRLLLAALLGGAAGVRKHLDEAAVRTDVIWALGFGGFTEDAVAMLVLLRDEDAAAAKLAGEAFGAITGYESEEPQVAQSEPAAAPAPLEQDDLDADLVPGPTDELPVLDPAAAEAWWQANRERFDTGRRYMYGRPHGIEALRHALGHAPLRRRDALATALRIASGGAQSLAAWAFVTRQRRELAALAALRAGDLSNRF